MSRDYLINEINHFQTLTLQLTKSKEEIKKLKETKDKCEKNILDYLISTDQPGVKHNNLIYIVDSKKISKTVPKKEKIEKGKILLQTNPNLDKALEDILNMKQPTETKYTLKVIKR